MALTLQIKVETSSQRVSGELQITEKFIYLLNTSRTISQVQLRHVGVVLWRTSSSAPEHAHTVLPEPTRNQKSHADKLQHGASGTLQSVHKVSESQRYTFLLIKEFRGSSVGPEKRVRQADSLFSASCFVSLKQFHSFYSYRTDICRADNSITHE